MPMDEDPTPQGDGDNKYWYLDFELWAAIAALIVLVGPLILFSFVNKR